MNHHPPLAHQSVRIQNINFKTIRQANILFVEFTTGPEKVISKGCGFTGIHGDNNNGELRSTITHDL